MTPYNKSFDSDAQLHAQLRVGSQATGIPG